MAETIVSSKGQVVLPKEIRDQLGMKPGTRLRVVAERGGVFLSTAEPRKTLKAIEVAGMIKYDGPPITEALIQAAIDEGMAERWARKSRS